jgi:Domain of unknown function (DUF4279)
MAAVSKSTASVRFFGDELDPDEVTRLLGCDPSKQYRKGDLVSPRREHRRKFGAWIIATEDRSPEAIDDQLASIFARTTQDLQVWHDLVTRYEGDVFCGLFMSESNEGFSLSVSTLQSLAARGLEIGFDVYGPDDEPETPQPCSEA